MEKIIYIKANNRKGYYELVGGVFSTLHILTVRKEEEEYRTAEGLARLLLQQGDL